MFTAHPNTVNKRINCTVDSRDKLASGFFYSATGLLFSVTNPILNPVESIKSSRSDRIGNFLCWAEQGPDMSSHATFLRSLNTYRYCPRKILLWVIFYLSCGVGSGINWKIRIWYGMNYYSRSTPLMLISKNISAPLAGLMPMLAMPDCWGGIH